MIKNQKCSKKPVRMNRIGQWCATRGTECSTLCHSAMILFQVYLQIYKFDKKNIYIYSCRRNFFGIGIRQSLISHSTFLTTYLDVFSTTPTSPHPHIHMSHLLNQPKQHRLSKCRALQRAMCEVANTNKKRSNQKTASDLPAFWSRKVIQIMPDFFDHKNARWANWHLRRCFEPADINGHSLADVLEFRKFEYVCPNI